MGLRFSCVGGGGGSWKIAVVLLGAHTPGKNPRPFSRIQAYIACSFINESREVRLTLVENDPRNVCRNACQTVVL
jgi:hypothetical protein